MATEPKKLPLARLSPEARRIARLAEQTALFNAQRWFARERAWINEQQLQLCRVPAPTFFEQQRAEWLRAQLELLAWHSRFDRAGNLLASFGDSGKDPELVLSAHLDTVLAPARPEDIYFAPDGRLCGPGSSDNGSGLAALLAIARVLRETPELHELASSLLLVANVGEEGEGNLSGMRYLCRQTPRLSQVKAFIVLDGPSTDHITAQALASRRFEISFSGPGGHSWNDYGTPNPVHALSELISLFLESAKGEDARREGVLELANPLRGVLDSAPVLREFLKHTDARISVQPKARCSYNFGIIEGGTSINSIPASALAKLDLRSDDPGTLDELNALLVSSVERCLERENRAARGARLAAKVKELGSRPGGTLPEESPLLRSIQAVDAYLNIRSRLDCASTDANVPLSLGLPAISIGSGGQGSGAHSTQEWYHPDHRELGLRRILLLLAALAELDSEAQVART